MGGLSLPKMVLVWFLFLLGIAVLVHGLPTQQGFISIDCGIGEGHDYTDDTTQIAYTSDSQFINTGTNHNISSDYKIPSLPSQVSSLRSFEIGSRNCYYLNPVKKGHQYLVRAFFLHGNYDNAVRAFFLHGNYDNASIEKPLQFDLHLGVNVWKAMNISNASRVYIAEAKIVASADYIWVCLVNTGSGTPFISSLELRPLKYTLYSVVNTSIPLVLYKRLDMGSLTNKLIRYPDDPYDRIWKPFNFAPVWTTISTDSTVKERPDDFFEVPSAVLSTAATPANDTILKLYWNEGDNEVREQYLYFMHFAEIDSIAQQQNFRRTFNISLNGGLFYGPFTPIYLLADCIYTPTVGILHQYNISLEASASILPPILNALEIYTVMLLPEIETNGSDVDAIMAIKEQYQLKRNWMGDPCAPNMYSWDGLTCSYNEPDPPRIITLNLSSSGLTGEISAWIANLKAITYLDLSNNNITGALPDFLAELPSLQFLNLTGNQLNGSIPSALLTKSENGALTLSVEGNPHLCINDGSCEKKKKKSSALIIVIVSVLSMVLLLVIVFVGWRFRRSRQQDHPFQLESRQFTYNELEKITCNFERDIGKGGFGTVYYGSLQNGTQVAVKMRSQSSSQGTKEFLAEAQLLTRVHHRNLVSLVGYCKDGTYLALVYEYMAQGSLQDHLRGKASKAGALSWSERLRIALEAAQGLEYLHKGCSPPIIHRDVKTSNILLSQSLEAKIADFGLSTAFLSNAHTHVSASAVVGTPGYLDPEYHITFQLNEKSDVYSFGVVLMELITGQPAILASLENSHISQWVRTRLDRGEIADVADERLRGEYSANSMWKIADVAMRCTERASIQRPDMSEAVLQLKEALALEVTRRRAQGVCTEDYSTSSFEIAIMENISAVDGGPEAR